MSRFNHKRGSRRHRRGLTLLAVIVLLSVSLLVLGGAATSLVKERQQCRLRHTQRQCRMMVAAALDMAELQLAANATYKGDAWTLPASESTFAKEFRVEVKVVSPAGEPVTLQATAQYPAEGTPEVTETDQRTIDQTPDE